MSKPEILVLSPFPAPGDLLSGLEPDFVVHRRWQADDPEALVARVGPHVRGLVVGSHSEAADLIGRLPKLEIVANFGVGYGEANLEAASARGLPFTNTPDVLTDDVADLAIGLLISVMRRLPAGDTFVRAGKWGQEPFGLATKIAGKTMGVLGLGRIGGAIARRAEVLNLEVVYHGPREKKGVAYRYYGDLAAMARDCDILMVACPGSAATDNLVNAQVLESLGPKGYLVNISRGSVVDEPALVVALAKNQIAGTGLDVFVAEPMVPEALKRDARVVLTPHVGSATDETRIDMSNLVLDNLRAHFAGKPLLSQVNAGAHKKK